MQIQFCIGNTPSLTEMLAACDPNAPMSPESEAWINGAPVGKEKI